MKKILLGYGQRKRQGPVEFALLPQNIFESICYIRICARIALAMKPCGLGKLLQPPRCLNFDAKICTFSDISKYVHYVQTIKTSGHTTLTEVLMCRNKIIGEKITIFVSWKDCR